MEDVLAKLVSLCKRRGFVFQSSEIYGGLKSCYDFGPLGAELKRNLAAEWWRCMVTEREDVVGLDASIIMHPKVWEASGHLAGFSDPLVDCLNCKERFRADKAPKKNPGEAVQYIKGGKSGGEKINGVVSDRRYICPNCSCPEMSDERQFNLMFRTSLGPVDIIEQIVQEVKDKSYSASELRSKLEEVVKDNAVYLRPETAQAMFVQFLNVQQSMSMKVPFGIAQTGRSFRNEVTTERFIFRTVEFDQMEMEFFVEPGSQLDWHDYWVKNRLGWWQKYANRPAEFRPRVYEKDELAHYADACVDIEYLYPWGWDELEGIASRTDYDLGKHTQHSGVKLNYFDQQKNDPETGKPGWRYMPYVIEPAAGLNRGVFALLLDAYCEEEGKDADGEVKTRTLLKLNPKLAPIKAAVLPLVKKDGLPELAREMVSEFFKSGITAKYDEQQSIGKRYSRHDEIGTPYCFTVDHQSLEDQTVTIRDRDTTKQERVKISDAIEIVRERIRAA